MRNKLLWGSLALLSTVAFAAGTIHWGDLIIKGQLTLNSNTASTVPYLDANKIVQSSAVTPTELGFVHGVGSSLCGITDSCTLTNKTISGSSNTITNISLTSGITGTLGISNGGTGQTTANAAFNALSPMTTLGDITYEDATPKAVRLVGNTTSTKKYLSQTGTGTISAVPAWAQPACGDLSNAATSCSTDATNASNISSGTLGLARGGTNADLSATGGTSQVLKQISTGASITVARLACADLSNAATSCSTDATNATNISSGTLSDSRIPTTLTSHALATPTTDIVDFTEQGSDPSSPSASNDKLYFKSGHIYEMNSSGVVTQIDSASSSVSYNSPRTSFNLGLSASVATSALTIRLKQADGSTDPANTTSTEVSIAFRDGTLANGKYSIVNQTAALSIVVPSSATLGQTSAVNQYVWVYALNDAGTMDLCVSGDWVPTLDEGATQSVTAISSSATSSTVVYCGSAHTGAKPIRLIGQMLVSESTAGTWASAPTQIALMPIPKYNQGPITAFTGSWIGAVNPVFGTHTENSWWRREGRMMHVHVNLNQTATTGSTGGTAPFRMTVPNSSTIDSTWQSSSTSTPWAGLSVGSGALDCGGSVIGSVPVVVYDSTHITILEGGAETLFNCSPATHSNVNVAMEAWIPISGWSEYGP